MGAATDGEWPGAALLSGAYVNKGRHLPVSLTLPTFVADSEHMLPGPRLRSECF